MAQYIPHGFGLLLFVLGVGWYSYRWGFDDGRAEGYENGQADSKSRFVSSARSWRQ